LPAFAELQLKENLKTKQTEDSVREKIPPFVKQPTKTKVPGRRDSLAENDVLGFCEGRGGSGLLLDDNFEEGGDQKQDRNRINSNNKKSKGRSPDPHQGEVSTPLFH
jgi:hypothetical protein